MSPAQTPLQFSQRKPNRLRCVSIGKGGFSFEFHKYLPFFISKRKNYAHPLRIPRETRSRVNPVLRPTVAADHFQIQNVHKRNKIQIRNASNTVATFFKVSNSSKATVT